MPELPEVEIVKQSLVKNVKSQKIFGVAPQVYKKPTSVGF